MFSTIFRVYTKCTTRCSVSFRWSSPLVPHPPALAYIFSLCFLQRVLYPRLLLHAFASFSLRSISLLSWDRAFPDNSPSRLGNNWIRVTSRLPREKPWKKTGRARSWTFRIWNWEEKNNKKTMAREPRQVAAYCAFRRCGNPIRRICGTQRGLWKATLWFWNLICSSSENKENCMPVRVTRLRFHL